MDIFQRNDHKVILGDCIDVMSQYISNNSVDLIFADPPYNIGKSFNGRKDKWETDKQYLSWCYKWLDLCIRKLKDDGSFYVMASTQFMPYFDIYLRDKLTILSRIVWYYDSSGVQARKYYGSMYEPILFCVKDKNNYTFNTSDILIEARTGAERKLIDYRGKIPKSYNTQKVPGNVWVIPRVRYRMPEYENHPTQKPLALLERIITASSDPGDIVLDPFAGTFTTCEAAKQLNRHSIGIEIDDEYVKIGLRRLDIQEYYNGEKIIKQPKTYQIKNVRQMKLT